MCAYGQLIARASLLRPAIRHGFPTQAAKDEPSIDAQGAVSVLRCRRSSGLGTWICTLVVRCRLDPLNTISPSSFANELPALSGRWIGARLRDRGRDRPVGYTPARENGRSTLSRLSQALYGGAPKTFATHQNWLGRALLPHPVLMLAQIKFRCLTREGKEHAEIFAVTMLATTMSVGLAEAKGHKPKASLAPCQSELQVKGTCACGPAKVACPAGMYCHAFWNSCTR